MHSQLYERIVFNTHLMSTEEKKPSKADYRNKNPLEVFCHQIHQKLATDVIGVSFDAQ